jgi:sulfatase maturation enzyme AslB (radical SAM superfamily)
MKQITGQPYNIATEVLGKITTSGKNILGRTNYILVKKDATSVPVGYSAIITNSQTINSSKPSVCGVNNLDSFEEGDVVLINSQGEIIFLYERESLHNAIFVTGKCNHRCIMCPQPPITQEEDKTPFNLKLISLIDKGTLNMGITGGEPTLVGDKLFDIIKQIKKYQPKASISLLSNGVKFADRISQ